MSDLDRHSLYEHPLAARYADKALSAIWSNANKFATWRKLWVVLAKAEMVRSDACALKLISPKFPLQFSGNALKMIVRTDRVCLVSASRRS
jgi:adenylosuccinate lyase